MYRRCCRDGQYIQTVYGMPFGPGAEPFLARRTHVTKSLNDGTDIGKGIFGVGTFGASEKSV